MSSETKKSNDYLLSIVIPMFNEELGAAECVRRVSKVLIKMGCRYEVIYVNDGSRDQTLEILLKEKEQDEHIKIIDLSRNFGHQTAISAGIDHAQGDALIVIDGDLQDPPELFPKLVDKWQEGFDVVHARRSIRHGEKAYKKLAATVFYRIMASISTVDIPVDVGDFRLMSKRVTDQLKSLSEKRRYIRGLAAWIGFKQTIVEYEREPRFAGTPAYTFKTLVGLALSGITGFSVFPLRLGLYFGSIAVTAGLLFVIYCIFALATQIGVPDWAPLMVALLFISGLQFICIGVVGEYVYLTLEDVRDRPLYIVRQFYNSKPQ